MLEPVPSVNFLEASAHFETAEAFAVAVAAVVAGVKSAVVVGSSSVIAGHSEPGLVPAFVVAGPFVVV